MKHNLMPSEFDKEARDVQVLESLRNFILSLDYETAEFILSLGADEEFPTSETLKSYLERSLVSFGQTPDVKKIFYTIISNAKGNVALSPAEIEAFLAEIILEND